MPWRLKVTPTARKQIANLPERDQEAITAAFDRLVQDPRSVDLKKLGGREGEWRLRVGRWRAILELDNAAGIIRVVQVLARGRAYRN